MSGRFTNPYPQFFDSTPNVYSGGTLSFYASGTSTLQDIYTDEDLATPASNPLTLNSAGRPSVDIFLQDLDYKVVLKDSSGNTIWTADPVKARDSSYIVKTLTGSGSPNGAVAGTAGSATILPDFYWDYTNSVLYVCTTTGTSSTAVWTAINAGASTPSVPFPQGRLTPTSGTPVISSAVTSGTSLYYTPFTGNLIPIYNGTTMTPTEFSELTLSLVSSHATNTIYDVFVFSNSGVLTLVTGPAWATSTAGSGARGTGASTTELTRVKGLWVNAVQMTARNGSTTYTVGANLATYVGSIWIDSSAGQITCHLAYGQSRKWAVWNAYNRKPITLIAGDGTASWNNSSAVVRTANGAPANSCSVLTGLAEEVIFVTNTQLMGITPDPASASHQFVTNGIGVNSTTVFSGTQGKVGANAKVNGSISNWVEASATATHVAPPQLGVTTITALEQGNSAASVTVLFYGTQGSFCLTTTWLG
jgi:hypothetical protein